METNKQDWEAEFDERFLGESNYLIFKDYLKSLLSAQEEKVLREKTLELNKILNKTPLGCNDWDLLYDTVSKVLTGKDYHNL